MSISKGFDAFGIDQFAMQSNRPDLVLAKLGLGSPDLLDHYYAQYRKRLKRAGISKTHLEGLPSLPRATILKNQKRGKKSTVSFRLEDDQYNLKSYNIYVNDVPVFGTYGKAINGKKVEISEQVELTSGKNKIEISCFNEIGVESFRALAFATYDVKTKGDLYYIGFGVSDYKNKELNLKYAHKEALDIGNLRSLVYIP